MFLFNLLEDVIMHYFDSCFKLSNIYLLNPEVVQLTLFFEVLLYQLVPFYLLCQKTFNIFGKFLNTNYGYIFLGTYLIVLLEKH